MKEKDILSLQEILKWIQSYYQSNEYHALKVLNERKTMLDIFKKSKSETVHSAMIAWCFANDEFNRLDESPVLFLLRLLAVNAESQKNVYLNKKDGENGRLRFITDEMWNDIVSNSIKVKVDNVYTEEKTEGEKNGRADIVILLTAGEGKKVRICIENKVGTNEHDDQCKKYFNYYNNKEDGYINFYVVLAPYAPKQLSCNNFICITYQDLLDNILYPIQNYKEFYSEQSYFYLDEYINTITSIKAEKILAMSDSYKNLLRDFYYNNEDLIFAAIEAVGDENAKKQARDIRDSATKYILTYDGNTHEVSSHSKMALEVAKFLATKYKHDELLKKYGKVKSVPFISKEMLYDKTTKEGKEPTKRTYEEKIKCTDGNFVYCSNQWSSDRVNALKDKIVENKDEENIKIS